jgi:NADH-quinone oxidoreductase subunit D
VFGTSELEINLGPQHPSTHGVLRVKLRLDGERIVDAVPIIGYLHRGCEKLGEERPYPQTIVYTDRMDYVAAVSENLVYVETVERLLGVEVPPRAQYMRVALAELQRIASHLLWLATHALDIGAMTVFLYCFREREQILDLFEGYGGARLTTNAMRIGGMYEDFPRAGSTRRGASARSCPRASAKYDKLLKKNASGWSDARGGRDRRGRRARLRRDRPVPAGVGCRLRRAQGAPVRGLFELEFDVPLGTRGDTYDRYLVRMEEMRQSRRLVLQAL